MARANPLKRYKEKRDFDVTPEPAEGGASLPGTLQFVVQKHWARRLHYDFRIELDGAMKSWAVPKGPSYDTHDKRMAVHVEDHPISYNQFEGEIPARQYGAGKVIIWDKGTWTPIGDARKAYRAGHIKFELHGYKLRGRWALVRMHGKQDDKQDAWLLIKEHDEYARPASEFSVVDQFPDSVAEMPMPTPGAAAAPPAASAAAAPAPRRRGGKAAASGAPADAVKAALPAKLSPLLATLVDGPPPDPGNWIYEIKFDGYRLLTRIDAKGTVRLFTRNGHDWSERMPHLVRAIERMKLAPCWLDGEIVVLNESGGTDFQALQNAFDSEKTRNIVYFLFDLPHHGGFDLTGVPLLERRALLQSLLAKAPPEIRFSEIFDAPPEDIVASACKIGLEGVIGKRKNSTYASRRSPDWIKLKCSRRQEFVIGGYTDPKGSRVGIGALLIGVHDEKGDLVYSGAVGAGFNGRSLTEMLDRLTPLRSDERPFKNPTENDRRAHWVKPVLLAEVTFSDWTKDGHVRHPVFHSVRTDKPAKAIVREKPVHQPAAPRDAAREDAPAATMPANFKVSHADRVVDPSTGITKVEVVRFYGLVAPLMMEHLKGRPVSFVRAPQGIAGQHFFQKHVEAGQMDGVRQLDRALWPSHPELIEVAGPLGLLSAAQMNVVEFHTWNGVKTLIAKPDRMTFDLDPGEGVGWPMVLQSAELMRVVLDELGLPAFCKTSGGKGLHVVVPLKRQYDWDTVKDFSQAIVRHMARTLPQMFVAKSGPSNRIGRIFIDYLRNGFGATTVCAWSLRARPGMGVSVPVDWEEVPTLTGGAQWNLRNIHTRLDRGNAPWAGYAKAAISPGAAMRKLGFEAGARGRKR
ncbi:bifunctional non-homologous end joining protein LigD [Variovorax sp. TBS-050B]|uniref:DNA ligase D n=1 Tax=Variovorax sp. TBS-050B TaxID=2940551 RepID=UPI002476ED1A|nr:DNA ligase D [Variovorax sp. TBS-050B]MDH6595234.1 bifunctional non-homologous end joining protein LigD [Variovorax sp. TBS-050B]